MVPRVYTQARPERGSRVMRDEDSADDTSSAPIMWGITASFLSSAYSL